MKDEYCKNCPLYDMPKVLGTIVVNKPTQYPHPPELMIVGRDPGQEEIKNGLPFVGRSGKLLRQTLKKLGIDRYYLTNACKCRPPQNRDPLPSEIQNCDPWLEQQIKIIRPRMIVTLGRYSLAKFFPGKTISKIHGTAQKRDNLIYYAMYHPAAALHQQSLRQAIEADMLKIPSLLAEPESVAEDTEHPRQLSMF